MSGLSLRSVSYRYPSAEAPAVEGVDLDVAPGELVLLTGPTGCGKSTLIRLAAGLLQRHGRGAFQGDVRIGGHAPAATAPSQRVRLLGFVSQEPGDQLVAGTVGDELAFGLESAGAEPAQIDARLPELLGLVGLSVALERETDALSGGQTQRLVTGAALAAGAGVLLLDEPIAQLDPGGARALLTRLRALADDPDRAIAGLMVEHRLEACLPFVDRVVVMAGGRLIADAPADEIRPGAPLTARLRALGLSLPGPIDLADRIAPIELDAARFRLEAPPIVPPERPPLLRARGLRFRYPSAEDDALAGVDLSVRPGERIAILGGNGAGKSTLMRALTGELDAGSVERRGAAVAVPQDPDLALFCPTVGEELAYGPREQGLWAEPMRARIWNAATALSVEEMMERAPQALSRGQRLRVAVAAALACAPAALLLDEPTSGQDRAQIERMMRALRGALSDGALLFATHDVDLALRHATRAIVMKGGAVIADGPPAAALRDLPADAPLSLPPLAAFCLDRGMAPATAEDLAARLEREPPPPREAPAEPTEPAALPDWAPPERAFGGPDETPIAPGGDDAAPEGGEE